MLKASEKSISIAVLQHVEESAVLRNIRSSLIEAPHVKLHHLRRFDDRLAAHLDGISVARDDGWTLCLAALQNPGTAELFVATVRAVEERRLDGLQQLLAVSEAMHETDGPVSAFGWLEPASLQGIVKGLLVASEPFRRLIGVAACAVHRIDFRVSKAHHSRDVAPAVRARALRSAGELGLTEQAVDCTSAISDEDPDCSFWAAWSSVVLGNRNRGLDALTRVGETAGVHEARAFRLAFQAMSLDAAHKVLQQLGGAPGSVPRLIRGSGLSGNPTYVPWRMSHMSNDKTARLAGEAFSLITGTDLALLDLERNPPENFEPGPTDDPNDPNVEMDPDEGLPWPDAELIRQWWDANRRRFTEGVRYFMGAPVTREHCISVLKSGFQRQRILAAHYLCLLEPGTALFNTSAPAWRQQRQLARMT